MQDNNPIFNRIIWITIFCAVAIAPLLPYRLQPISDQIPNAWAAIGFSIFLIIYSTWLFSKKINLIWSYPIWGWCAAFLLIFIHTRFTLAGHKDALIFPIIAMILAGCIHLLTMNASAEIRKKLSNALAWAFYVAGLGTTLIQLHQLTDASILRGWVFPLPADMQPFGNVAQRNEAAFLHSLAMAGVAHWLTDRCTRPKRIVLAVLLMLPLVFGISLTGSRLFLLVGGVMFATSLTWLSQPMPYFRQNPNHPMNLRMVQIWAGSLSLYAAAYAFSVLAIDWIPHRPLFASVVERISNVSNITRIALQQQAWAMFIDKPLTGQGWGSFSAFGLQWSDRSLLPLFADHSHFLPSQIMAEMGLLGVAAFSPLAWLIFKTQTNRFLWKSYFFPQCMCTLTIVYSCSEFPLWNGYYLFPFALCLGILTELKPNESSYDENSNQLIIPAEQIQTGNTHASSQISAVWIALIAIPIIAGTAITSKVFFDLHILGGEVFTGKRIDPLVFEKINKVEPAFGFSAIKEVYLFVNIVTDTNDLESKIALGERVTKRFTDAPVLLHLGILYALNKEEDKSTRILQDACRFYPLKCEETIGKIKDLPDVHEHIFQRIHQRLIEWWPESNQNPNKKQSF